MNIRILSALVFIGPLTGCTADWDGSDGWGEPIGQLQQPVPKSVCADGMTTPGIDVSYYQGQVDWQKVAKDDVKFAITRVNHGGFMDPRFDENWAAIKKVGLLRGAYQYFNPGGDPVEQAQVFIDKVGRLQPGDLPGVLDVESTDGESPSVIASRVQTWLDLVEEGTGRKPMIYTGGYFWNDSVKSDAFADYPLWTAHYTSQCPYVPDAWDRWAMWQYTSSGSVDGISGNVDRNRFNGSLEDVHDLAANGYRAEVLSIDYPAVVQAGTSFEVNIVIDNLGARTWSVSTHLGTTKPRDRTSAFVDDSWVDATRPYRFDDAVTSGQQATISMTFKAPTQAGQYTEYFNLVEQDVAWFSDIVPGGGPDDDVMVLSIEVTPNESGPSDPVPEDPDGPEGFALTANGSLEASCSVSASAPGAASKEPPSLWLWLVGLGAIAARRKASCAKHRDAAVPTQGAPPRPSR